MRNDDISGYRLPANDPLQLRFMVAGSTRHELSRRFREAMYRVDSSQSAGLHPDVLLTEAACTPQDGDHLIVTLQFGFGQAIPGLAARDAYGAADMSDFLGPLLSLPWQYGGASARHGKTEHGS